MVNKIVIADADRAVAESIQRQFDPAHYEIHLAHGGQDALAAVQKIRPDIVIADALLPGLSGFELCKALRSSPATADIPIIVTSTNANMEDAFLYLGIKDFAYKPLDAGQVKAKVLKRLELLRAMQMQRTKILFHGTNEHTLAAIEELVKAVPQWDAAFVPSGKDLVAKAREFVPDVVVVDLFINDMHVDAAIAQIKKMPDLTHAEVLTYYSPFLTSQDGIALQAKMIEVQYLKRISLEAGAREYLGPFNPSNFLGLFSEYRKDLTA